ncbi:zinc/iron-chelating domain-containing protein [Ferrigenium kumadai]|uniref:Zinc/iron-chelating domain-containing protein n=1 Tax=Ferrigenium kumadai TaxID=1682490 RepID=A0AAN1SZS1_9PROT|nr:YkgJ family cysteine cluster protein [Ferrigenium kumadai]BBI98729.1 zinc/iron-chelating domain-containing protein [Ferrigenium kumadai]
MTNAEKLARIDELLSTIPGFPCKPGCADCCGPVEMTRLEYHRVIKASGRTSEDVKRQMQSGLKRGDYHCPLLDRKTNRCSVYAVRPAICRLFGVVKDRMPCPHGCAPDAAVQLSDERAREILALVEELGM